MALRSRGAEPPLAEDLVPKANGLHAILDAIRRILSGQSKPKPNLLIELKRGLVWHAGVRQELSQQQYDLRAYMYQKKGAVCSPEELLNIVYGEDVSPSEATTDERFERLIARVRDKIEDNMAQPQHLVNVQGHGYRLDVAG